jgi:serine phosphatase RsbU (regulator of sigma subunit)
VTDADATRDERLRRLEAVADAALSRLDVADLLDELIDRVRDLLDVDTVTILLLEAHAQELVATAARGLEDEVRRGSRIAVGQGFAGRVARSRRPLAIHDLTRADVVNPVLIESGVRSLLGVPILAGDDLLGVLHIGTRTARRFTAEDQHLLELVAERVSLAIRARSGNLDRTAAIALQHSLLPTHLPSAAGVQLAARYIPGHAAGVGGDWYDVFHLPSGWLGVVIGDVAGHGLRAAVVMGRIRSALRAYALVCDDPAEALTLLDRKVQHFEAGTLTTALYAMISPDRSSVVVSVAGHLRPLLAVPGEPTAIPAIPVDPPLGITQTGPARRRAELAFPPGAGLTLFTDGLVERRGRLLDQGIAELTAAVTPGPAERICAGILTALIPDHHDDTALLVISRDPGPGGIRRPSVRSGS